MRMTMLRAMLAIAAVALVVAACSSSASSAAPSAAGGSSPAPMTAGPGGAMTVTDAWARAMAPGSTTSAVYLKIANGTGQDDALVSVKTTAPGTAEIHEVMQVSAAPDASADAGGMGGAMMGMQPIEKLPIPSGQTVELKPGAFHIMLINVTEPLKEGSTIDVTLTFEKATPITLTVPVKMS